MKRRGKFIEPHSSPSTYTTRDKLILAGLYLSKFDEEALNLLGFETFTEAFNAIGLALRGRPMAIKNYRDEFDPYFPNQRVGWHKRDMRAPCRIIYDAFRDLPIDVFTPLLKAAIYSHAELDVLNEDCDKLIWPSETFAKRMITGQAAEKFFVANYQSHEVFAGCSIEDTTQLGCGFDFRLSPESGDYLVVEVKGLSKLQGSILLTQKEYAMADVFAQRFFLYIVRNFADQPFGSIYQNPLHGELKFMSSERTIIERRWNANI